MSPDNADAIEKIQVEYAMKKMLKGPDKTGFELFVFSLLI